LPELRPHTRRSFDTGLALAKKFNNNLTIIECLYKIPPKFYFFFFFETKSDKKITEAQILNLKQELRKWKGIAEKEGLEINTKFALTDSIAHWVIDHVKENKVELLVVGYPKLSMIEENHYDDIINMIRHKAHCNVLTTKN